MVIRQYKARGPVSEMLLPVVAMDDALGLIAEIHLLAQAFVVGYRDALHGQPEFLRRVLGGRALDQLLHPQRAGRQRDAHLVALRLR